MLLQEKMKHSNFSPSEKLVIDFILNKQELIEDYSTMQIAEETYTTPSILVRIAKKLDFNGYKEFKKAFLKEVRYLKTSFHDLDANTPFQKSDSILTVADKITQIKIESLNDTLSLIQHDSLQKAISIISQSKVVRVFTISNLAFQAEEFVFKMRHIGKMTDTYSISNTMYQEALMTNSDDCAICISYSGESPELLATLKYLKRNSVPIIAITSIGVNSLSKQADTVIHVTTREKSYTKIAGFTSLESISLALDILYSCYFNTAYDKNYKYKVSVSRQTEYRDIDNSIIQDKEIDK